MRECSAATFLEGQGLTVDSLVHLCWKRLYYEIRRSFLWWIIVF